MFFAAFLLAPAACCSLARHLENSACDPLALFSALGFASSCRDHGTQCNFRFCVHYALFHEVWNMRALADWSDPWRF